MKFKKLKKLLDLHPFIVEQGRYTYILQCKGDCYTCSENTYKCVLRKPQKINHTQIPLIKEKLKEFPEWLI